LPLLVGATQEKNGVADESSTTDSHSLHLVSSSLIATISNVRHRLPRRAAKERELILECIATGGRRNLT
jgi:hypothetical protein